MVVIKLSIKGLNYVQYRGALVILTKMILFLFFRFFQNY
jgi:hypothetical protein